MALTNDQAVALLKKNPVIAGSVVLCLVLAAGIYFRMDLIPEATATLQQKSAEGQRLAANIKNAAQLGDQLAAVTAANKEIDTRLVRVGALASNLQYFYKLEADTGVKLLDLRQVAGASRTGKEKPTYLPVVFNLSVQGTYPQVFDFLRRLQSGSHYCRIMTANFVPAAGSSENSSGNSLARSDSISLSLSLELLGAP
ncbi:MAG: hypothetical protein KA257_11265 [Opitutaceae bacterium]|nr:hypothetical protein [Opitutaceae bacterium]